MNRYTNTLIHGHTDTQVPNDTAYTRWSCHIGLVNPMQIVSTPHPPPPPPAPSNGGPITVFWASRPCGPAGWLAMLLIKADDLETNPGLTTTPKQVWICDISHRKIQVRKQIWIRCNRIEHWVHLRCVCIRLSSMTSLQRPLVLSAFSILLYVKYKRSHSRVAPEGGSSEWLLRVAPQGGSSGWLLRVAPQGGSSGWLLRVAPQGGSSGWLLRLAPQAGSSHSGPLAVTFLI